MEDCSFFLLALMTLLFLPVESKLCRVSKQVLLHRKVRNPAKSAAL